MGKPPFYLTGTSPLKVIYAHMNEEPRPPRELNPELTAEVEAVVLRALSKEMESRPTADVLAADLAEALGLEMPTPAESMDDLPEPEPEERSGSTSLTDRTTI